VELGEDDIASFPLKPPAQLEKGGPMSNAGASVYVVDDDASVREAVESLIRSAGLKVETFASAREFLASSRADVPSCLLLDVELPGLSGLDLQRELAAADVQIPIIFLTGHGDIPMTVRAIKAGALEFLTKPVDDEDLLGAIRQGIASYHAPQQPCRNLAEHNFEHENLYLEGENRPAAEFAGIVGQSSALRQMVQLVETVATTDTSSAEVHCDAEAGKGPSFLNFGPSRMGGVSMLERAVCRRRLLPAESLRSISLDIPTLESLSAVSRMVALISHDLRHPLTAILANAEFLTQANISEMQRNDFYQEIRWAIDRMNELVSSLSECSKGRDTLRPAVRNIVDTVERVIRMTTVRQEFRCIAIKHHHEGMAVGWFDSNRLERVVANLVLNACEAVSPDSGQIVITTNGDRACLRLGVWDNGPGIPPTIQDSAFEPFVSYGKSEGSGLGLAIAKKIVEDHGGEIYLDGRCETGTLFKITIPFAIPEGALMSTLQA
jgi:FixJ family two-component response regulator/nitrogen-specific signal transduction histidine kinase